MFENLTDRLSKSFGFFRGKKELTEDNIPVSYTHLTLPTICSV